MPGQNRSGPTGMGPKTGRGMGLCAGTPNGAFAGNGGARRGRGRGFGCCGNGTELTMCIPEQSQKEMLTEQKKMLEAQLAAVTEQLEKQ